MTLPPLPLEEWRDTKTTLHQLLQIVGKVRLASMSRRNHWWHVPLYVSTRGLTTRPMPRGEGSFELELDLIDHELVLRTSEGAVRTAAIPGRSVADLYRRTFELLGAEGITVQIPHPEPFAMGVDEPFPANTGPAAYDAEYVGRYRRILAGIEPTFQAFASRFAGKTSPVHVFWHSMDLAVTRFSGRRAPDRPDADPVTRDAYSHEVTSFGFWVGDDRIPYPAFYAYAAPEPAGLADQPLRPREAAWSLSGGGSMALLPYDDVRAADDPAATLLEFLESAYQAGARTAGWDLQALAYVPPA